MDKFYKLSKILFFNIVYVYWFLAIYKYNYIYTYIVKDTFIKKYDILILNNVYNSVSIANPHTRYASTNKIE